MTFLNDLNRDIVETHKNMKDMNETLAMTLQHSTKWNIASRLLSGTGLWAVQNRLRAVISVVGEYQKGQLAQLETHQKNAELMKNLEIRTEKLTEAKKRFNKAEGETLKTIESDWYTSRIKTQEKILALNSQETQEYKDAYKKLQTLNKGLEERQKLAEDTIDVIKERNRIMDHYGFKNEESANIIMQERLSIMEETAKRQNDQLRGSEKYRKLEGAFLVDQIKNKTRIKEIDEAIAAEKENRKGMPSGDFDARRSSLQSESTLKLEKRNLIAQEKAAKFIIMRQKIFDKLKNIGGFIKTVLSAAKSFLIYGFFVAVGLALLFKIVKDAWPIIQDIYVGFMEVWNLVTEYTGTFMDVFKEIWGGISSIITGIFDGNITKVIAEGFIPLLLGLAKLSIKILLLGVGALVLSVGALGFYVITTLTDLVISVFTLNGDKFMKSINRIGALTMFIAGLVALIQIYVLGIAATWAPIGLAMAAGAAMMFASGAFAKGGVTPNSGTFLVGEEGPELVNLPGNSRIHSNGATRGMMGNTINVHINGRLGASDQEIRDIARKVGAQINREINRTTSSGTRM